MLFFKKLVEFQEMETARFVLSAEFYLETQWKSMPAMVLLENHVFPSFLAKSNLFKGLFCQRWQKVTFWSLYGPFRDTFLQKVSRLGWFNEGFRSVFSDTEK